MSRPQSLDVEATERRLEIRRAGEGVVRVAQHAEIDRRPYVHPILAPDGTGILTEDAPPHHPWQHGLYVGLNDVNGVGFWTEGLGGGHGMDGSFHPMPLAVSRASMDDVSWRVETEWRGPDGSPMLQETQEWTFRDLGEAYELDLDWSLAARLDLTFGRYDYGGLFLRMPYRAAAGGRAVNSEGQVNQAAEGQRARWVAVSMPIEGRTDPAGIAMMDHVDNPKHPVPWRVDGQLGIAPSRCIAGSWRLGRGETTRSRYRLLVFLGAARVDPVETSWRRFNGKAGHE